MNYRAESAVSVERIISSLTEPLSNEPCSIPIHFTKLVDLSFVNQATSQDLPIASS